MEISKIKIPGNNTPIDIKDTVARSQISTLSGKVGVANGIATLGSDGKVPASQLPVQENTDYVDLGLPSGLLWATCNIGAHAPEEAGMYFSWGNVQGHTATEGYNFDDTTYNTTPGHSLNGDIPANADYDAAVAARGNGWRMPSSDDFQELYDNCTWTWTIKNNINGYEIEGQNGNKIFLPASGYCFGTSVDDVGSYGIYWSGSFLNANLAYDLDFNSGSVNPQLSGYRYYGFPVRPVYEDPHMGEKESKTIAAAINDVAQKSIEVEYGMLKCLRDNAQLIPGMWYRITDWTPQTVQDYAFSHGESFDILVLAVKPDALSEVARAARQKGDGTIKAYKTDEDSYPDEVDYGDYFLYTGETMEFDGDTYYVWKKYESPDEGGTFDETEYLALTDQLYHEGDLDLEHGVHFIPMTTDGEEYGHTDDILVEIVEGGGASYFDTTKLEAWELLYCLDNDLERFKYADTVNGCGVIYRVVDDNNVVKYIEPVSGDVVAKPLASTCGKYKAVDLGLPSGTLWADCNVGAENPEDAGMYFSWGSVEGAYAGDGRSFDGNRASEKNWSGTYGRENGSELGNSDNIPVSMRYDAALKNMGAPWQMPTKDDFQELADECTWTWTTKNGVNGYEVEGPNRNKIFLPASGSCDGTSVIGVGTYGNYWSNLSAGAGDAYGLYFDLDIVNPQEIPPRYYGNSVRPVCKMEFVDLALPSGTKWATCNLGAVKPYETGLYYSWGNIEGHEGGEYNFNETTYNNTPGHGLNGDIPENTTYDAARAEKGENWRMPTKDDFQELYDNCISKWVENYQGSGVNGRIFFSKRNYKSVFFPASGRCFGTSVPGVGLDGFYWSSSFVNASLACFLNFNSDEVIPRNNYNRYYGFPVRPVQNLS